MLYANILGNWVNLHDDPNCEIDDKNLDDWYKRNSHIFENKKRNSFGLPSSYPDAMTYLHLKFMNKNYRINFSHIQILINGSVG